MRFSLRFFCLLLACLFCAGAALAAVDTSSYSSVIKYVQQEQPMALELGKTSFTFSQLRKIQDALPKGAVFSFEFFFCYNWIDAQGTVANLDKTSEKIYLSELYDMIALMPNLQEIVMVKHTHFSNNTYITLMETYPDIQFDWPVRINDYFTCPSNATAYSTNKAHTEPFLKSREFANLQYIPGLKALDLGHNAITSLDFLLNFPDLHILILAGNNITDLSVLSQLTELEYLEIFMNEITDLSPLAGLTNLKDLNIVANHISDLTPLDDIPLERLWCSRNSISAEEIARFCELHPDCVVDFETYDATGNGWRDSYKYEQFRDMFTTRVWRPFEEP